MVVVNNKFEVAGRGTHFAKSLHCGGRQYPSVNMSSAESYHE